MVDKVIETGQDPRRFTEDLLRRLRDLVIVDAVPDAPATGLIDCSEDQGERLVAQAARFGSAELSRAADLVATGLTEMRGATAPRLLLELVCARVLLPGADHATDGVLARLDRLEKRIAITGTPSAAARRTACRPCRRRTARPPPPRPPRPSRRWRSTRWSARCRRPRTPRRPPPAAAAAPAAGPAGRAAARRAASRPRRAAAPPARAPSAPRRRAGARAPGGRAAAAPPAAAARPPVPRHRPAGSASSTSAGCGPTSSRRRSCAAG